ncbi:MAG: (2Fe-2S)-binding protein [Armatimonadetes bacterium]|nr:(2Fe-2S)-binding protein [Armatimonadota bacterium]
MSDLTLTIDGREVTCAPGATLLQAAAAAGIDIPNLCAHPTLKPFGRCRLCLVEVKGLRGYPSACTTPAAQGMEVTTESLALAALRRDALELVLTEHPTGCLMCGHQDDCLDHHGCAARRSGAVTGCRFCPKDQQCELQAMVERLGVHDITFPVRYRGLPIDRRDPFFDRDYNLCILCARCVRACDERRHAGAIALTYRGSDALVGTAYNRPLLATECQFCGACVDVCPTASLAERVNKWVGTPTGAVETSCPFCPLGCRVELHSLDGQVVGARPLDGQELCAVGRFAPVEAALAENRLLAPQVRRGGRLVEVEWEEALEATAAGLAQAVTCAVYASADLLNEDLAAIAALARETLATPHLDTDVALGGPDQVAGVSGLDDIEQAGLVVTVRTDLRYRQTPVQLAVHRAVAAGAKLACIEPFANDFRHRADLWLAPEPGREIDALDELCAAAAAWEVEGPRVVIAGSATDAGAAVAARLGAALLQLHERANVGGVRALGVAPGEGGTGLADWAGVDALLSFGRPPFAHKPAGAFWVCHTDALADGSEADVLLPATMFAEEGGTLTDLFGRRQQRVAAVAPPGETRPAHVVCAQLAERLDERRGDPCGRPSASMTTVASPERATTRVAPTVHVTVNTPVQDGLLLVRDYSRYTHLGSNLAERVPGLIPFAADGGVRVHPDDALDLEVRDGDDVRIETAVGSVEARVIVTEATRKGTLWLVVPPVAEVRPDGMPLAAVLGANPGRVRLRRAVPAGEGGRVHV